MNSHPSKCNRGLPMSFNLVFFSACLILLLSACSSNQNVKKAPEFKFVEATITKEIKTTGDMVKPGVPTRAFSTNDDSVVAHVKFSNLSGKHKVQWKWYDPQGDLYYASKAYRFKTEKGKYVQKAAAFHKISIKGDEAQHRPGDWTVKILYDNAIIATKTFAIKPGKQLADAPIGLPPILSIAEISFSEPLLYAGESGKLNVTLRNTGPGDANDVYLELYSENAGLIFEGKQSLPVIPKHNGEYTVSIPVEGQPSLPVGTASLDVLVVEPHFRVRIIGKRLTFHTRSIRSPHLILAKFAAVESESSAQNHKIDINEVIDIKIAVQNVGDGPANDTEIDLINNQVGVMFLGRGEGQVLSRKKAKFNKIDGGKYQVVNYRFFVNSDFREDALEFVIKAYEGTGKHGFVETKLVKINTDLQPEGYIRDVATAGGAAGGVIIEDIPDFEVDVDVNIPQTVMHNSDGIAVIIGNRNYENKDVPAVKYARNDAEVMKQYLIKTLGYKEGNILFETDASKTKFEALFGIRGDHHGILNDFVKPGRSDVFVYYSGHGAPDLNSMKGYFVPVDCDPAKIALNGYPLDLFYENIAKTKAKTIIVVLDACFSGSTNSGNTMVQSASPALIKIDKSLIMKKNAAIFASSTGNQVSSWYDAKRHGLFTYFFLKAIGGAADKNNDSQVTYNEIQAYVSDRTEGVPYWAKRLHGGRTQTPVLQSQRSNAVLVRH